MQTNEPDDVSLDWHCFLCGVAMHAWGPKNRMPVFFHQYPKRKDYLKRRRFGEHKPTVLACDSCVDKLSKPEVSDDPAE